MQTYYILYSILDFSHEGTAQLDKFPQVFHNFRSQLRFPMNLQLLKVHE